MNVNTSYVLKITQSTWNINFTHSNVGHFSHTWLFSIYPDSFRFHSASLSFRACSIIRSCSSCLCSASSIFRASSIFFLASCVLFSSISSSILLASSFALWAYTCADVAVRSVSTDNRIASDNSELARATSAFSFASFSVNSLCSMLWISSSVNKKEIIQHLKPFTLLQVNLYAYWAYLMNVIPETRRIHKILYLHFYRNDGCILSVDIRHLVAMIIINTLTSSYS